MEPDATVFNPKLLFESSECARLHVNMNEATKIIVDEGKIQSALASVLPQGSKFYVNAMKKENDLYSYEDTRISSETLYHKAAISNGECLTFSSIEGDSPTLQSAGVDCDTKLMPLCFRETGVSDLSFLNKQCSQCGSVTAGVSCHEWRDLEDYYQEGDPFKITGAEICVKPCGPKASFDEQYCQVWNYNMHV